MSIGDQGGEGEGATFGEIGDSLWAAAEMFAFWVVFDTFELVGETPRISLELRRRLL